MPTNYPTSGSADLGELSRSLRVGRPRALRFRQIRIVDDPDVSTLQKAVRFRSTGALSVMSAFMIDRRD